MLRAGSLIYAIGISLVLAISSTWLILLAFNIRTVIDNSFIAERQINNVNSGLNYYLANSDLWISASLVNLDLFKSGSDSVDIQKKKWGLFQVITCSAHQNNNSAQGIFLVGNKGKQDSIALYLSDQNKPLALCGNTLIKGRVYIPSSGIKRAYIEGQNFTGIKLIDGTVQTSSNGIPEFDNTIQTDYDAFSSVQTTDSIVEPLFLQKNKSVTNSFNNRTLIISSSQNINLNNYHFEGNIVIKSTGNIEIGSGCFFTDILIEAKSIKIDAGFKGSLQAFASDSIILGERSTLLFPSNLCILKTKKSVPGSKIVLLNGTNVKGSVINFNETNLLSKSPNIEIQDNCKIMGMVYTKGYVSHKGSITGSLYCAGFMLRTPSAIYENHLLNCTVNGADLPYYYVGISPILEFKRNAPIKRLE